MEIGLEDFLPGKLTSQSFSRDIVLFKMLEESTGNKFCMDEKYLSKLVVTKFFVNFTEMNSINV